MFGNKNEENRKTNYELQLENVKLKIQAETLQFKLDHTNEKYSVLEKQLKDAKDVDVEKIKSDNESLRKELSDLKFKLANDTTSIELETENKKLKAEVDIQKSENKHLKDLLDAYRSMPDVKNMVDSLSSLAVPHIDELKEFTKIISDSKVSQLCDQLSETDKKMNQFYGEFVHMYDRLRGVRY